MYPTRIYPNPWLILSYLTLTFVSGWLEGWSRPPPPPKTCLRPTNILQFKRRA